jgi:NAD(P)-dependent dehydrogenase (short-subunit alcohol dehydrogenase family)
MRNTAAGEGVLAPAKAEGLSLHVLQLDVTDGGSVSAAIAEAVSRSGPIDVLVNNAGVGGGGPIEEASDAELHRVFETNYFGALRTIRQVLPSMRERRRGTIVNVTSQGGRVTFASSGVYCATKFALEASSESLAIEVAKFGVRIVIIEPGVVLTPIFGKPPTEAPSPDSPYARERRRFAIAAGTLLKDPTTAQECADVILHSITTDSPRLRYTVGSEADALIRNRAAMTDEEWIALANVEEESDFKSRIAALWGEKGRLFSD